MADFALLKLPKPSSKVTAYVYWKYWIPTVGDKLKIVDWGGTSSSETHSNVPMEKEVEFVNHDECENIYGVHINMELQCAKGLGHIICAIVMLVGQLFTNHLIRVFFVSSLVVEILLLVL
jgi:hypothetical protein